MPNLDLRPGTLNVTTYYKGDYSIRFTFTQDGDVYPLTDVTAATFVISEKNGTAALTLSSGSGLTINGAGGYIDMAITNAQIVALYSQEYNYEFSLTLNSTTVWPILDSVFIVSEDGQTDATVSDINITLDGTTVDVSVIAPVTSLGGGTWGDITGILSDQTDLQTALDGKVDENAAIVAATKTKITYDTKGLVTAGADAEIADITGLQSALDGKAAAAHTHPLSDLTQSGATTGQVPKWDGAAWVPDDEAGGADGNGIYTGSGTVDISGGDVEATLSNHAGGLKLKYADGVTGIEIVNGATPADSYAQLINGEDTAYVYADTNGAVLEATGGLSIRVSPSGIEINGPSGTGTAGQVWTADGAGYGDFQDASGGSVSIIDITYTDMETAIAGATLTPGQFYRITDASGTDLGFVCQAVRDNEITVSGTGGYLNADFQAVGNYDGVEAITGVAPGTQLGIWQAKILIQYENRVGGSFVAGGVAALEDSSYVVILSDDDIGEMECYAAYIGDYSISDFLTKIFIDNKFGVTADIVSLSVNLQYSEGDIVIWNGAHYQLTSAADVDGNAPDSNTDAYTLLEKTAGNVGYITSFDVSGYDFANNVIIQRSDVLGNIAYGSGVENMQWGRDSVSNNIIYGGAIDINSTGGLANCTIYPGAFVGIQSDFSGTIDGCTIFANAVLNPVLWTSAEIINIIMSPGAEFSYFFMNSGGFFSSQLGPYSVLGDIYCADNVQFEGVVLGSRASVKTKAFTHGMDNVSIDLQLDSDFDTIDYFLEQSFARMGGSNIPGTLDITGLTALDFTAAWAQYRGIYNLTSSNATETISADSLTNFPTLFPFRLIPAAGLELTLTCTAAGSATNGSIVGSSGTIVLNGDNGDFVELESDSTGTFVRVKNLQIYA